MPRPLLDRELPPHPLGPWTPQRVRHHTSPQPAPSCRGGRTSIGPTGHVLEYVGLGRAVAQHRLVAECYLGRLLRSDETVHHRNRVKTDNRWENLEILLRREHGLEHRDESRIRSQVTLTEPQVREALVGRTTAQAAELLGVSHTTLRGRFPHLLDLRTPPGGPYRSEFVVRARALAANPRIGTRQAARDLGTTVNTLRKCCQRHGIVWLAAPAGRPSRARSGGGATR